MKFDSSRADGAGHANGFTLGAIASPSEGMSELEQVTRLCRSMGADEAQAQRMAEQLLKRADQIAVDRGCDRVQAMQYLLGLTMKGAQGEAPPGFEGGQSPESPAPPS